jgi:hypothetical protein
MGRHIAKLPTILLLRDTLPCIRLAATVVRLTFTSLTNPAEAKCLSTVAQLPDRTMAVYVSRLCNANGTTFMSTAGQRLHTEHASNTPVFTV